MEIRIILGAHLGSKMDSDPEPLVAGSLSIKSAKEPRLGNLHEPCLGCFPGIHQGSCQGLAVSAEVVL